MPALFLRGPNSCHPARLDRLAGLEQFAIVFLRLLDSNVRSVYEHAKLPSGCSSYSPFLLRIHPEQRYAYCTIWSNESMGCGVLHCPRSCPLLLWTASLPKHCQSGFQPAWAAFQHRKGKIDNLRTPFFSSAALRQMLLQQHSVGERKRQTKLRHLDVSARKKTRDNHDFNPQSSCLMPQASCTANRTFTLLNNI